MRFPSSSFIPLAALLVAATGIDAFGADAGRSARFLEEQLLPLTRHFAYIETVDSDAARTSALWAEYAAINGAGHFAIRHVARREDIYPVFRELFRKEA